MMVTSTATACRVYVESDWLGDRVPQRDKRDQRDQRNKRDKRNRFGQGDRYAALTGGLKCTMIGAFNTAWDVGILVEYLWD